MEPLEEQNSTSNWLKELQEKSWEPEILISGIVIYGLFKLFPLLEEIHLYLENYGSYIFNGTLDDNVIALIRVSISWLLFGFISHLILRSFWVAYIGLSYVYDDKIEYSRLKFKTIYLRSLEKDDRISKSIIKLEQICSTLFSVSILFFMNLLGFIFFSSVLGMFVFLWLEIFPDRGNFSGLDSTLNIVLTIFFIDYLTIGLLKRIPYVNKVFYPIYKLIGYLVLAPLYRKIYYTFVTNHKRWKAVVLLFLFIAITAFATSFARSGLGNSIKLRPNANQSNVMSPSNYLDEADGEYNDKLWIPSQVIETKYLEAFMVHRSTFEKRHIMPLCDYDRKSELKDIDRDSLKLSCLNQFYSLELDNKVLPNKAIYTKSNITHQDGLKHFIKTDSLTTGKHVLELYYNVYVVEKDSVFRQFQSRVEFFKVNL